MTLEDLVSSGKILSYSHSEAYIPIHDLSGGISKRFSYVFSVTVIYRNAGKRLTETFKGITRKDAERQVFDFVNGLK